MAGATPGDPYPIVDVSDWIAEESEGIGARTKQWMIDPQGPGTQPDLLLKYARSEGLPRIGADLWAEVVASRIASYLGVPALHMDFAINHGIRGVVSRRMSSNLVHGDILLGNSPKGYDSIPYVEQLRRIRGVLEPFGGSEQGLTGWESFVGQLVRDTLISNTDRHAENWAVDADKGQLLPCFDHGASLGFNATDQDHLGDVLQYARRGRSRPFGATMLQVAREGLLQVSPTVCDLWLGRVEVLGRASLDEIVQRVPTGWMSDPSRTFVVELVLENRRRLLE